MGAVTVTQPTITQIYQNLGQKYWINGCTITMSNSYSTGGDTITPQQIGFGCEILDMNVHIKTASVTQFFLFILNTQGGGNNPPVYTIQAFTAAASTGLTTAFGEVTAGTNLSTFVFGGVFVGV